MATHDGGEGERSTCCTDRPPEEPQREPRDGLARRLDAVERAVTGTETPVVDLADAADTVRRVAALETTVDGLDERVAELEAATQALRGYVGAVRAVNREVERRADAALATADALEAALLDDVEGDVTITPIDGVEVPDATDSAGVADRDAGTTQAVPSETGGVGDTATAPDVNSATESGVNTGTDPVNAAMAPNVNSATEPDLDAATDPGVSHATDPDSTPEETDGGATTPEGPTEGRSLGDRLRDVV